MPFGLRLFGDILNAEVNGAAHDLSLELLHARPRLPRTSLVSFLAHDGLEPLVSGPPRRLLRASTSFDHTPGVKCDFEAMKTCEGSREGCPDLPQDWAAEGKTLTEYYKSKGMKEPKWINYWWPGKAGKGECNNITDPERGCWYKARLRKVAKCGDKEHCLAVAPQDGERSHRLTCPSWIRNEDGERCEVPQGWEACPDKFTLKRALPIAELKQQSDKHGVGLDEETARIMSVPDRFFNATLIPCAYAKVPGQECLEPGFNPQDPADKEAMKQLGMYFDLGMNKWYRCTPWMRCEKYPVKEIYDPQMTGGSCGEEQCREGDSCFVHEDFGTKELTSTCVPHWNTYVISDSSGVLMD